MNAADDNSVIKDITTPDFMELKAKQIISGGMIPKLENAFAAIAAGVKKVVIGNADELKDLIYGNAGTTIH